jgi:hypothetical protein
MLRIGTIKFAPLGAGLPGDQPFLEKCVARRVTSSTA